MSRLTVPVEIGADPGSPAEQLADAMRASGIVPPSALCLDGRVHRFASDGRRGSDKSGWYVAYGDGTPAGKFGCWRMGIASSWRAVGGASASPEQEAELELKMRDAAAQRDAERARHADVIAGVCSEIWQGLPDATPDHPYLARKGVRPHGLRVTGDGRLVAPLFDGLGDGAVVCSLQYIDASGGKLYHAGGAVTGRQWVIGDLPEAPALLFVAEGVATAATIHEVTGAPVVVAYSASNLVPVVGSLREAYGATVDVVVVADNDKSGLGQRYAEQAAAKHGARVVVPPTLGDANDYVQAGRDLLALLAPKANDGWLVSADDFAAAPAPISWLIRGWVQSSSLMMIHGPSGHGKTFVVLDWCLTLASGLSTWRECKAKDVPVVYLAGEGHHGLRGRVAAWREHHGVTTSRMWLSSSGCDLDQVSGLRRVVDAINALPAPPALIVVDTLHRFLSGDENSAQDARAMLDSCAALQSAFGCSVLLVHHTGNSEEAKGRARGSSAWRGALDVEVSVSRVAGDDDTIEIAQRKSKDAEMLPPVFASLRKLEIPDWYDEDGVAVTSAVLDVADAPLARLPKLDAKGKKLEAHRKLLERAWWHTGAEVVEGAPYVSRSAMRSFMVDVEGLSEASANQRCKPSDLPGRPIRDLIDAEIVQEALHGWKVIDDVISSQLLLSKAGRS